MMMPTETLTCDKECRIQFGLSITTCMYYAPVYDKNGIDINPDANTTSGDCKCTTCGKAWGYSTRLGETTYKEIK
jgi:hypothetical protein